jgi:uncharacterized protein (UPF0305 family)
MPNRGSATLSTNTQFANNYQITTGDNYGYIPIKNQQINSFSSTEPKGLYISQQNPSPLVS